MLWLISKFMTICLTKQVAIILNIYKVMNRYYFIGKSIPDIYQIQT